MEVTTRKKALEMGLNPPYPRIEPDDFPTFQGNKIASFNDWVADHVKYPAEAQARNLEGWVFVNFKITADGSISDISPSGEGDKILQDEVIKVITSVGSFEPPKNVEAREPMTFTVSIKFKLPDQIAKQPPFIVVDEMPMYPGGDKALLQFIKDNVIYPEELKEAKIGGRVIVRFAVNTEGNAEAVSVLKGVHPDLDKEAIRVVKMLKGFKPGIQGGIPVPVWYMVPVTFGDVQNAPAPTSSAFSNSSSVEILKFIAENTKYPFDARKNSNQGKIYVTVRMQMGGIVRASKAVRAKESINVPIIPEIVIVGYKSDKASDPNELRAGKDSELSASNDKGMELLEQESVRVANLLGSLNIPEWKDKDMEFALSFNYVLR
jgi:TonB family protein